MLMLADVKRKLMSYQICCFILKYISIFSLSVVFPVTDQSGSVEMIAICQIYYVYRTLQPGTWHCRNLRFPP